MATLTKYLSPYHLTFCIKIMALRNNRPSPGDQLRQCLFQHADSRSSFMPAELVPRYVTLEMVERELSLQSKRTRLDRRPIANIHQHHVILFNLLCLVEKGDAIWSFVKAGISDPKLPLLRQPPRNSRDTEWRLEVAGGPKSKRTPVTVEGFQNWSSHTKEAFIYMWQWRLTAPFLAMGSNNIALHHDFSPEVILPWSPL